MKILIADKFSKEKVNEIKNMGCSVIYNQELKEGSLLRVLEQQDIEILIVRSTEVSGEMIKASSTLSLIIRAGSGYNTIDVKTASDRSVYVANCPGKNSIAVAELAFGLLLALDRRIPDNVIELKNGKWNKKTFSNAEGIYGKILGIIGLGRIGREMVKRATVFGLHVISWSRSLTPERAEEFGIKYAKSPEEVAVHADIISVHLALTSETNGIIGTKFFESMKPGAYFINTSRAEIVDHTALVAAMNEKGIRAALDVLPDEPELKTGEYTHSMVKQENLYGTHHIGASTGQAQRAVADETVRIVKEYVSTGKVLNSVNVLERTPARYLVSVHHKNRVGILADVLDIIREAKINVENMENIIFNGTEGACARIRIDGMLSERDIKKIRENSKNIYSVTQAGILRV
jgi:D-3-phosphoglycerate dehydrogenase